MPRRRVELDRDEKTCEMLDAAIARLRRDGYDAMSVAAIARELGIAGNTVYWYFPSKDHLVVAAVQAMLANILARKPPAARGLEHQVLWFTDQLAELADLRAALSQRAATSPVIAEFVDDTNTRLRQMLTSALASRVDASELDDATDAFLAAVHGAQLLRLPPQRRRRVLRYVLRKIVGTAHGHQRQPRQRVTP